MTIPPARTKERINAEIWKGFAEDFTIDMSLMQTWGSRKCTNAEFVAQLKAMIKVIEDAGGCSFID